MLLQSPTYPSPTPKRTMPTKTQMMSKFYKQICIIPKTHYTENELLWYMQYLYPGCNCKGATHYFITLPQSALLLKISERLWTFDHLLASFPTRNCEMPPCTCCTRDTYISIKWNRCIQLNNGWDYFHEIWRDGGAYQRLQFDIKII